MMLLYKNFATLLAFQSYAWILQGVCLEVSQKFYLISRLFLEIETWYFTWRCSIMGHLIIKKWCDQYHLLDISNDCVKNLWKSTQFSQIQVCHQCFSKTLILRPLEAFFGHGEENKKVLELNFTPENILLKNILSDWFS